MKYLALTMAILSSEVLAASDNAIPEVFLGKWTSNLGQCDAEFPVDVFKIKTDSIIYWERNSKVVTSKYENAILTVSFIESVEGDTYNMIEQFELKDDGNTLTRYAEHGDFISYRCHE